MARKLSIHSTATLPTALSTSEPFSDGEVSRVVKRNFRTIANRYHLGNEIGRGGLSRVYSAFDFETDRVVAVKQTMAKGDKDPLISIKNALTEAAALMELDHKAIIKLLDYVIEDGEAYLVLEKLEESLIDAVKKREVKGRLRSIRACLEISSELSSAVAHMHSRQVIHRDIKPGNISLTPNGPKLFDFGLARCPGGFDPLEANPDILIGSLKFMSPEQAGSGNPIGPYSDLYSFGATMYWMLSLGKNLFYPDTDLGCLMCHRHQKPKSLKAWNPLVPDDVVAVVEKALQKDPKDRFRSADEMKKAIDGCIRKLPAIPG